MLPVKFAEQQIRVYFRKNEPDCLEKAERWMEPVICNDVCMDTVYYSLFIGRNSWLLVVVMAESIMFSGSRIFFSIFFSSCFSSGSFYTPFDFT